MHGFSAVMTIVVSDVGMLIQLVLVFGLYCRVYPTAANIGDHFILWKLFVIGVAVMFSGNVQHPVVVNVYGVEYWLVSVLHIVATSMVYVVQMFSMFRVMKLFVVVMVFGVCPCIAYFMRYVLFCSDSHVIVAKFPDMFDVCM